ncbi:histidine-rich glycoprotein-like isoform X2 [Clinocottus analis]|uniref:histidine-rich glycoprotein-like isoform X2 n=1 Tax=Clinocottus analis TaxID=304258 RepID=UPI0035BFF869
MGENGMVFYLTLDVVETNCSVHSKKDWKACEIRDTTNTPVYGQCKAAIYISKVHRVMRLYKYNCIVRPVPAARVSATCPDCPSMLSVDDPKVKETVSLSLEKFNREGGLSKRFALLKVSRARAGYAMSMYYNVEYSIQETTCLSTAPATDPCPFLECEFSHKGFCKGSLFSTPSGSTDTSVDCEIYEPEAAEREKILHELAIAADHKHRDTHAHSHTHDAAHAADSSHTHDHVHDHTKSHAQHNTQQHAANSDHHHTHDHAAGSGHGHGHDHSHDHGHGHDHVHTHHAKAHNHTGDFPNQHHNYHHAPGVHTHEHDHELALDHDHNHPHLHEHEHHHHHHDHVHEPTPHDHPEGVVTVLPAMGQAVTLPAAGAEVGVTLPLKEDPQIPGQMEPTIMPFPMAVSANCPPPAAGGTLVEKLFLEDPMFKPVTKGVN